MRMQRWGQQPEETESVNHMEKNKEKQQCGKEFGRKIAS